MKTLIKNCHLISPDVDLLNAAILIDGEKIVSVLAEGDALPAADTVMEPPKDPPLPPGR